MENAGRRLDHDFASAEEQTQEHVGLFAGTDAGAPTEAVIEGCTVFEGGAPDGHVGIAH
jgi:hypothetical protein